MNRKSREERTLKMLLDSYGINESQAAKLLGKDKGSFSRGKRVNAGNFAFKIAFKLGASAIQIAPAEPWDGKTK